MPCGLVAAQMASVRSEKRFEPKVLPLGDTALLVVLAETLDPDANALARRVALEVRARRLGWVTDVIPALVTVAVHFAARTAAEAAQRRAALEQFVREVAKLPPGDNVEPGTRTVEIPVCYEAPFAPDLDDVARRTGLAPTDVVRLHAAGAYHVLMIGFAPGHPYLGGLDPRLAVPRRASPRVRVEPGSVAIANEQTSIYSFATPGGWNLIGRTPLALFDPTRERASLLAPGDTVAFVPIPRAAFEELAAQPVSG